MNDTEKLMSDLARVLVGKDISAVAPALVVSVARVLMLEANNDPDKLGFLVFKFQRHLIETLSEMAHDEGFGESRQ